MRAAVQDRQADLKRLVNDSSYSLLYRTRSILVSHSGWVATAADSAASFPDVNLSEKEWCDYDENQVGY